MLCVTQTFPLLGLLHFAFKSVYSLEGVFGGDQILQLQVKNLQTHMVRIQWQFCIFAESADRNATVRRSCYLNRKDMNGVTTQTQTVSTSTSCWLLLKQFLPITQTVPPEPPPVIFAPNKVPPSDSDDLECCISCTKLTSLSVPFDARPQAL